MVLFQLAFTFLLPFYPQGIKKKSKEFYFVPLSLIKLKQKSGRSRGDRRRSHGSPPFSSVDAELQSGLSAWRGIFQAGHLSQCVQLLTPRGVSFPFQHPVASWLPPQPASRWAGKGLFQSALRGGSCLFPGTEFFFFLSFFLLCVCGCMFVCISFFFLFFFATRKQICLIKPKGLIL